MRAIIVIPETLEQQMPFNALYLASKLRDEHHMVDLIDQNICDIWRYMDPQKQSVFISSDSHQQYLRAMHIRERLGERRTITFGLYPTVCHQTVDFLAHGWNHVVIGDPDNIPATMVSRSYQKSRWCVGPLVDIDSVYPAWEYLDMRAYFDEGTVPICTERPSIPELKGYEKPRIRDLNSVIYEMCELNVRYEYTSFSVGVLFFDKHKKLFEDKMGRLNYSWEVLDEY